MERAIEPNERHALLTVKLDREKKRVSILFEVSFRKVHERMTLVQKTSNTVGYSYRKTSAMATGA